MLFGGGVDVSVVQYCWIPRFLTERDVRLSVLILTDRWFRPFVRWLLARRSLARELRGLDVAPKSVDGLVSC